MAICTYSQTRSHEIQAHIKLQQKVENILGREVKSTTGAQGRGHIYGGWSAHPLTSPHVDCPHVGPDI